MVKKIFIYSLLYILCSNSYANDIDRSTGSTYIKTETINNKTYTRVTKKGYGDYDLFKNVKWFCTIDLIKEKNKISIAESSLKINDQNDQKVISYIVKVDQEHKLIRFYIKDSRGITANHKIIALKGITIPSWILTETLPFFNLNKTNAIIYTISTEGVVSKINQNSALTYYQ